MNDDEDGSGSVSSLEEMLDVLQGRLLALERLATASLLDMASRQSGDTYRARAEKLKRIVIASAQHMNLPLTESAERVQQSFGIALRTTLDNVVEKAASLDGKSPDATDRPK